MSFKAFEPGDPDSLENRTVTRVANPTPHSLLPSIPDHARHKLQSHPDTRKAIKALSIAEHALAATSPLPALGISAPEDLVAHATAQAAEFANAGTEALQIAEHPLRGRAIADFATTTPLFAPALPAGRAFLNDSTSAAAIATFLGNPVFDDRTRLLRFYAPLPEDKRLFIDTLQGEAELSALFRYSLTLISTNAGINLKEVLGKNVTIGIVQADGSEEYLNGFVGSFAFMHADGGFASYQAEVMPWLEYLSRRINSRIFQDRNVRQVLEDIFSQDYSGIADVEFRISGSYPPENYIVQYNESDQDFISRLLEKYGLFYYFEHREDGHRMIISDDSCNASFCPPHLRHGEVEYNGGDRTRKFDTVTRLAAARVLQPAKIALNTFDFKAPTTPQYVEMPSVAEQGEVPQLEVYDGNPAFHYKNTGDGEREARLQMETLEWQAKIFTGDSDCRSLMPGHTFILKDHHWFEDNEDAHFLVLSVSHVAHNNYINQGAASTYSNSFTCIRRRIPYRPRRLHQKPRMPGPQTATVVGPQGVEIHTDRFGRIKVQFPWDRYGKHDDASSCWIRVSQPWAGKDWGTVAIPRIGQEVIIDYLEGDPDRPVCTGRLFNADQPPPYPLPGGAHIMGFKSRSTPGGGGYCEMVIHDKKGQELINIHSQKDMVTTVQHTQTTLINGPHQTNVVAKGYQSTRVNKKIELESQTEHIHLKAATSITLEVGASKIHMDANGTIRIEGVHVNVVGSSRIDLNNG